MDEHNVFWCNQFSRMHANVWLVCMMSVATAVYAIFSVFTIAFYAYNEELKIDPDKTNLDV